MRAIKQYKREKMTAIFTYFLLLITLIAHIKPVGTMFFIALGLSTFSYLVTSYIKTGVKPNSFLENHMVYLMRTYWVGSVYLTITLTIAVFYAWPNLDNSILNEVTTGQIMITNFDQIKAFENSFYERNKDVLIKASFIAFAFPYLFFAYRCLFGLWAAFKDRKLNNLQSWF